MRATWIILCILALGCFADASNVQGGTDGSEGGSESAGSEGTSASSTSASSTSAGTSSSASTSSTDTTGADTTDGGATDTGADGESSGGSTDESGSTGTSGAPTYEPCASDDECASGICLVADAADGGYCTSTCAAHEECDGYPMLESGLTISCAGSWGPNGESLCLLSCFQDPPGECPAGTTCGTHDYNGEPSGGLCG